MKFLHVIASVDPAGGGPIEGAVQLHRALTTLGHSGAFVSLDGAGSPGVSTFEAPIHPLGPARGRFGYSPALRPWLEAHAPKFDAVIVNGLWQYTGLATRGALRKGQTPYFVFPHGMLDPWFKRRFPIKHLKKWLYWPWAEYRVLRDARRVLFTCEEERLLARQSFWLYRCHESVVSFGTAAPNDSPTRSVQTFEAAFPQLRGKRLLLFLGRIHPKKGCDLLIEAFAQACAAEPDVHLVFAGPDQEGWQPKLQQLAQRLGVADRICWAGMLQGDLKWGAFRSAEAFCLPSHQENFGIAVVEALACGCPVLISDKVNIWREIEQSGAGFVATDTLEGTRDLIGRWMATSEPQWTAMRAAAARCFDQHFRMEQVARNLIHTISESSGDDALRLTEESNAHV